MFPEPQSAAVNVSNREAMQRSVRKSRVSFMRDSNWLTDRVRGTLCRAASVFEIEVTIDNGLARTEPIQLAEYGEGGAYGWHLDIGPGTAAVRKLSISVQLSSPDDYDGGDLEIWGAQAIDRNQGTAIVFPSFMLHRVRPVIRGMRRSLVGWAVGECGFR